MCWWVEYLWAAYRWVVYPLEARPSEVSLLLEATLGLDHAVVLTVRWVWCMSEKGSPAELRSKLVMDRWWKSQGWPSQDLYAPRPHHLPD